MGNILLERFAATDIAFLDHSTGELMFPDRGSPNAQLLDHRNAATIRGWYDLVGNEDVLVAFYRGPDDGLYLRLPTRTVEIDPRCRSEYVPADPGNLPWRLTGTGQRRFALVRGAQVLLDFHYTDEGIWHRLIDALSVTSSPRRAYDLLHKVHTVLGNPTERENIFT